MKKSDLRSLIREEIQKALTEAIVPNKTFTTVQEFYKWLNSVNVAWGSNNKMYSKHPSVILYQIDRGMKRGKLWQFVKGQGATREIGRWEINPDDASITIKPI